MSLIVYCDYVFSSVVLYCSLVLLYLYGEIWSLPSQDESVGYLWFVLCTHLILYETATKKKCFGLEFELELHCKKFFFNSVCP